MIVQVEQGLGKRYWEIDFLRGVAIVMMIIFHLVYDLDYFGALDVDLRAGFWWFFARAIATTFILLVGVSLTLSYARARKMRGGRGRLFLKYLRRGLIVFSCGLLITLVTWLFLRQGFVLFGVLHFIGVSIILAYPFLRLRYWNLLIGVILIALGLYLWFLTFDFPWLVWLGLKPVHFYTVDYFPILPWFGVVLIGLFFGNLLYPNYTRRFELRDLSDTSFVRLFCFLGRHSLLIYLAHQPILIGTLLLLGIVAMGF